MEKNLHWNSKSFLSQEDLQKKRSCTLPHKRNFHKRGSFLKKVTNLHSILPSNDFHKGHLLVNSLKEKLKSNLLISDLWGPKERYFQNTGYYKAYLCLQHKYEKLQYNHSLSNKQILNPIFMDHKALQSLKKPSKKIHKKSQSNFQSTHFFFSTKCSNLKLSLNKLLSNC